MTMSQPQKEQPKMKHDKPETGKQPSQEKPSKQNPRAEEVDQDTEIDLGAGKRDQRFSDNNPSSKRSDEDQPEEDTREDEAAA